MRLHRDSEIGALKKPVTSTFDHYGEATNPLEQRMMETGSASGVVSREQVALGNGRKVFVSFTFLKENEQRELKEYGATRRVAFRKQVRGGSSR